MIRFSTSNGLALAAAAGLSMTLFSADARATDFADNVFAYGICCGGPAVGIGAIPGFLAWGMWRTDNPMNGNLMQANMLIQPASTRVNSPQATGSVTLEAGMSPILTAIGSSSAAKVGVGTSTPGETLDVAGRMRTRQTNISAGVWMADTNGVNRQFMGVKVHSATGTAQEAGFWLNSAWRAYFKGDGQAFKAGGGSWSAISDARVKHEVSTFEPGLEEVEQVRPVKYKYNGLAGTVADGKEHVGVLAQDLERVAPFMVETSPKKLHEKDAGETNLKTVDPSAFTYMLINAVKELSQQNRELRSAVCELNPKAKVCAVGAKRRY